MMAFQTTIIIVKQLALQVEEPGQRDTRVLRAGVMHLVVVMHSVNICTTGQFTEGIVVPRCPAGGFCESLKISMFSLEKVTDTFDFDKLIFELQHIV